MAITRALRVLAVVTVGGTVAAHAAQTPADRLGEITVTATKVPTPLERIPGAVSVITADDAEKRAAQDIKDLVRYEPGITVRDQGSRFGLAGFTLRGLDADRVAIEIDGVAIPDAFAIGSFSNASRDFVDIDLLERTEIILGPASSVYGSDALGGVVTFISRDPQDFLAETDGNLYSSVKGQYASGDDSFAGTAVLAGSGAKVDASLAYVRREGHEVERQGGNDITGATRTVADPGDFTSESSIAKLVFNEGALRGLKLTLDGARTETSTEVLSALNAITSRLEGDDETERLRTGLDWEFRDGIGPLDYLNSRVYWQDSATTQLTGEDRVIVVSGVSTPHRRERRFEFGQELLGGELVALQRFAWGGVEHAVTWGLEVARTETEQLRDGVQTNLITGATTSVIGPDAFPVRDFPLTRTLEAGAFLQDEITVGALTFIPGVRFDYLDLNPEPDAVFVPDNPGIETAGLTESNFSPKLGMVWALRDGYSAFAQYAHGFRAPPYDDVNIGFTNLAFGYTAIPNPDLKAETSDGFELGARRFDSHLEFRVSAYYNEYRDFISSLVSLGVDPQTGLLIFQSQNVADVTIYGAEAGWRAPLEKVLIGLSTRGSLSWSRGENATDNTPIDSIDPLRLVLGLGYAAPNGRWGVEFVGSATEKKTRTNDVPAGIGGLQPQFEPSASYVFDLLGYLHLGKATEMRLAVYNLTDRTYWDWQDVRGLAAENAALERYSRPGRTLNASVRIQW